MANPSNKNDKNLWLNLWREFFSRIIFKFNSFWRYKWWKSLNFFNVFMYWIIFAKILFLEIFCIFTKIFIFGKIIFLVKKIKFGKKALFQKTFLFLQKSLLNIYTWNCIELYKIRISLKEIILNLIEWYDFKLYWKIAC